MEQDTLVDGGTVDRGIGALVQLFLWADPFADDGLNHALNLLLGILEALAGSLLISSGRRQLDYTDRAVSEDLPRVARRSAGELAQTLLGHSLRLVGVVRGGAVLLVIIESFL